VLFCCYLVRRLVLDIRREFSLKYDDSLNRWVEIEKEMLEQKDQECEERAE